MDSNKLPITWFTGLDEEEKEKFRKHLLSNNSNAILSKLKNIVERKRQSLEDSERDTRIYDNPSWSHKQAHNNGARQMLKYIEDLLIFVN